MASKACRGLTTRWSGRVMNKVPIAAVKVRAAQLNRWAAVNLVMPLE
jgi:hypothetical protein